jgi:hypothetical protein
MRPNKNFSFFCWLGFGSSIARTKQAGSVAYSRPTKAKKQKCFVRVVFWYISTNSFLQRGTVKGLVALRFSPLGGSLIVRLLRLTTVLSVAKHNTMSR